MVTMSESEGIIEALIFASPEPVTLKTLCKLLDSEPKEDVVAALAALRPTTIGPAACSSSRSPAATRSSTRPELHEWVRRLFHERTTQKLSVPRSRRSPSSPTSSRSPRPRSRRSAA